MKYHILILASLFVLGCKPEFPNHGFVKVTRYSNMNPGDTSTPIYYIWRSAPQVGTGGRLEIKDLYNQNINADGFPIFIQDYKTTGIHAISMTGNQIGDFEVTPNQFPNDSLAGIFEVIEADSNAKFFRANFSGSYFPVIGDTAVFSFINGYMEVHY